MSRFILAMAFFFTLGFMPIGLSPLLAQALPIWPSPLNPSYPPHNPLKLWDSPASIIARSVSGQFAGGLLPDIAMVRGDRLEILVDPDLYDAAMRSGTSVNDIDTWPQPTNDLIASISDSGFSLWQITAGSLSENIVDTSLAGSQLLRVGDIDNDGLNDIVTLNAQATEFTVTRDPVGAALSETFGLRSTGQDIVLLDMDGDGQLEIAVQTIAEITIFSWNGVELYTFGTRNPDSHIARVQQAGQGHDRLLWIATRLNGITRSLLMIGLNGVMTHEDTLGNLSIASAHTTDFDNDGDDDILLTMRESYEVRLLINQRTAASPTQSSFECTAESCILLGTLRTPPILGDNIANLSSADFDGDGDQDLAFPLREGDALAFINNDLYDRNLLTPRLASVFSDPHEDDPSITDLTVNFENALTPPATANTVELILWHKPGNADTQPQAVERIRMAVTLGAPITPLPLFVKIRNSQLFAMPVTPNDIPSVYTAVATISIEDPDSIYFWSLRYIELEIAADPLAPALRLWPADLFGYTQDTWFANPRTNLEFLQQYSPTPNNIWSVSQTPNLGPGQIGESETTGTIIQIKPITKYPPDEEPGSNSLGG